MDASGVQVLERRRRSPPYNAPAPPQCL